ncbi:response regulator transcription factor [Sulfurimonas lithotrophica]|uniref:Response regulator transcription factor n=1 Tax=Sulfurimonas lithotrophica TaxID=2590022 RepID=A0A5P8NZT3_9BACT|nr:LuxR C-terminal-related transcriptional regulator [Sulfurimonas lithotrophica]QFR48953.1 response regulator transcription factor [Sulfurimonas lithotrophica]
MQIIFFSSDENTINEWRNKYNTQDFKSCYDIESLNNEIKNIEKFILVCDYDSIAHDLNTLISSKTLPYYSVVLERSPAIATGKILIKNGVKAYGNSKMLLKHFNQLVDTVKENKTWTYPELTAALVKSTKKTSINSDAAELIESRLTLKERDVVLLVLEGLTNDAIANELGITTRTVKAHISSIFSKLHVNDRISLVLLLK